MNVYEITGKTLQRELEVDSVPDLFVVVAKHQVLGMSQEQIAETLACDLADIAECEQDALYQRVKSYIAGVSAEQVAQQASGWDAIESIALDRLIQRLPAERDPEFLLRVAAVANRATRRATQEKSGILDAARVGSRTIVLSQRLVAKINARGDSVQEETRQLSIRDGSMANPSFDEIDNLLTVRAVPVRQDTMAIHTRDGEVTQEALLEAFMARDR